MRAIDWVCRPKETAVIIGGTNRGRGIVVEANTQKASIFIIILITAALTVTAIIAGSGARAQGATPSRSSAAISQSDDADDEYADEEDLDDEDLDDEDADDEADEEDGSDDEDVDDEADADEEDESADAENSPSDNGNSCNASNGSANNGSSNGDNVVPVPVKTSPYESDFVGDDDFITEMKSVYAAAPSTSVADAHTWDGTDKSLQAAVDALAPGDTLYIRGGVYSVPANGTYVDLSKVQGKAGGYITIASYPGETAVFNAGGTPTSAENTVFSLDGASYLRISGIIVLNAAATQTAAAFSASAGANHIVIDRCEIAGVHVVSPALQDHCANAIVCCNASTKTAGNFFIYGNDIHDCATGWSEAVSFSGNCAYVNVLGNTVKKTGNIGIDVSGNYGTCSKASLDFTRHALIADNAVSGCVSAYGDTAYGIYADGAQNVLIKGNTVKNCSGGIEVGAERPAAAKYSTRGISVVGNTVKDNTENGITIGGWTDDATTGWVYDSSITDNAVSDSASCTGTLMTVNKCSGVAITGNTFSAANTKAQIVVKSFSAAYCPGLTLKDNTTSQG